MGCIADPCTFHFTGLGAFIEKTSPAGWSNKENKN